MPVNSPAYLRGLISDTSQSKTSSVVTSPTVLLERSQVLLVFNFVYVTLQQISVEGFPCYCAELENSLVFQWALRVLLLGSYCLVIRYSGKVICCNFFVSKANSIAVN